MRLLDRAVAAARRAVELDPTSQSAHTQLAAAYFFQHDIDAFSAEAERAVALNPNNADVLAWVGVYTAYGHMADIAKRERGIAMMKKAIALSPFHPDWYYYPITWNHYWKGEYEQALVQVQEDQRAGRSLGSRVAGDDLWSIGAQGGGPTGDCEPNQALS